MIAPSVRTATFCVALIALLSLDAAAAGLSKDAIREISELAATTVARDQLPGLSVAVLKDGEIWSAGFGKADLEQDVPVTAESMFRTASLAKWFTATAALRLVEAGKLDLDAPIQRYCPQFPGKEWPITSRLLLSHLAGIRHNHGQNGEQPATAAERAALEARMREERSGQYTRHTDVTPPLDTFKNDPLLFQPGTRAQYTSLGYRLLGCVLEGVAQKPYRQLMRELVFTPAGMTTIVEDDALALVPHRVAGYSREPNGPIRRAAFRDVSENLPAGGYLATATDVVRFVAAFQTGKLVNAASRDRMVARPSLNDGSAAPNPAGPPPFYYGMGIMVDPNPEEPVWFHTGGQSGASAVLILLPNRRIAVAVMTNIDGSGVTLPLPRKIAARAARD